MDPVALLTGQMLGKEPRDFQSLVHGHTARVCQVKSLNQGTGYRSALCNRGVVPELPWVGVALARPRTPSSCDRCRVLARTLGLGDTLGQCQADPTARRAVFRLVSSSDEPDMRSLSYLF